MAVYASYTGNVAIVEFLADEVQVDMNAQNSQGETPLYVASKNSHVKVVALLKKNGAQCEGGFLSFWCC